MTLYASAQRIGGRSHQCDATSVATVGGARAYVLLDGIGSNDTVRAWTRAASRRLAHAAAALQDAESGLRALHARYAAEPARNDAWEELPLAAAVVAVAVPGKDLTVAWCGDSRAYLLHNGGLERLTEDHNERRVYPAWGSRNLVTSCLGATQTDEETQRHYRHPVIESVSRCAEGRLLLASDGAYEPLEDSGRDLAMYLSGAPREAALGFVQASIGHAGAHVDNATVLIVDLAA